MDSVDAKGFPGEEESEVLVGQYHQHPYGELLRISTTLSL